MRNKLLLPVLFIVLLQFFPLPGKSQTSQIPPMEQQAPYPNAPQIPKPRSSLADPIAKAYFNLGKAFFYEQDWNSALDNFRKALARSPQFSEVYYFLGLALIKTKSYQEAEESIRKSLSQPNLPTVAKAERYWTLGVMLSDQGNYEKAEAYVRNALELDPRDPNFSNSLAYIYALQGKRLSEALKLVDNALLAYSATNPTRARVLDTRAWVYYKLAKYDEAERDALEAIKIAKASNTEDADLYYHLGEIFLQKNNSEFAMQQFQKALEIENDHKDALNGLKKIRK